MLSYGIYAQDCLPESKLKDAVLEKALIDAYNNSAKATPADYKGVAKAVSIPVTKTDVVRDEATGAIMYKVAAGIIGYTDNGKCYSVWCNFAADWQGNGYGEWYCKGKMNGHKVEKIDSNCFK